MSKIDVGKGTWIDIPTPTKYYIPYRIVAASDASDESKAKAHYVCDGTNDEEEIKQAINDLPASGGIVFLTEGTFNISNQVELKDNVTLMGTSKDSTELKKVSDIDQMIYVPTGAKDITIKTKNICLTSSFFSHS